VFVRVIVVLITVDVLVIVANVCKRSYIDNKQAGFTCDSRNDRSCRVVGHSSRAAMVNG
jgi:hypothetical protein